MSSVDGSAFGFFVREIVPRAVERVDGCGPIDQVDMLFHARDVVREDIDLCVRALGDADLSSSAGREDARAYARTLLETLGALEHVFASGDRAMSRMEL